MNWLVRPRASGAGRRGSAQAFQLAPEDDEVRRRYAESLLERAQADGDEDVATAFEPFVARRRY
jgi:hypothetical protein